MLKRILAISKKEIRQLKRDTRMLYVLFVFPFVLLVIFGYAINFDVHHIKMVVYNRDNSEITRDFINRLTSSNYFDLVGNISSESQIRPVLDRGDAQVVLVFRYRVIQRFRDFLCNHREARTKKRKLIYSWYFPFHHPV